MKRLVELIKGAFILGVIVIAGALAWDFFTSPPSTSDVCYTWSKATDQYLDDEYGIDGAKWLEENIKSEEDLVDVDKDVLEAIKLYEEGSFLEDVDPVQRFGLRQYVIDACEKAAPGSTKH